MDLTESVSARVLLRRILVTEPPKTPITRSAVKVQSTSKTQLSKKDTGAQTPQNILRRSLKNKMRESITRKSLPGTTRKRTSTPAPAPLLFDDGDTPRHLLKKILLTEPVKSPVGHETAASEEPRLPSASSSITRTRPSIELSGMDLPDLSIEHTASTLKGLRRKRPRRSLNVTAFEKRLKNGDEVDMENEESRSEHSSLSLSSSTSLNLKTPFVDVQTEKRGLQRRVSNRRRITEEEFGAAVNDRHFGGERSFIPLGRGFGETTYSEGFTLGLSKLSEPEITTDIVNCNTALYVQSDEMASNLSIVATQDKPTVMASQLQRQITEMEEEKSNVWKEKSAYAFPTKEVFVTEDQELECFFILEKDDDDDDRVGSPNGRKSTTDDEPKDIAATSKYEDGIAETDASKSGEIEDRFEAQTEEGAVTRFQAEEEEVAADSQTKDREEAIDSESEEDSGGAGFHPEEDVASLPQSDSEEEEVAPDSQAEEDDTAKSQDEDDDTAKSQAEEDDTAKSEAEEGGALSEEEVVESQTEDEHDRKQEDEVVEQGSELLKRNLEHINRRAYRSEGGLIPVTDASVDLAGWSDGKSKAHSAIELHGSLEMGNHDSSQPHTEICDFADPSTQGPSFTAPESDADKENVDQLEVIHDNADSDQLSDASPIEADEEDEEDGEESEEIPCKTPAFVREKRTFFQTDPVATTALLKNIQASCMNEDLPAAKPKQARQRKRRPAKKEPGLSKTYLMGVFKHFAKTKVSADVYPVLKETMDTFFDRLAEDLEAYAHHAKRNTIEFEDAVLLLRRQGYVNDKVPVEALIEKYLRMDQRRLLIPIATSGNVVIPKKR